VLLNKDLSQWCCSEPNSSNFPNSPFKEFVYVCRCMLARTSRRWCWWWCTCKLGVCTKSLVAFEMWWTLLDSPQLGIPSNSLLDWKNANMEFVVSNPNPLRDEKKLPEVVRLACCSWVDCFRGWLSLILLLSLTYMPLRPADCTW
jgi:hypothetical protein